MLADYHVHTQHSDDSDYPMEEVVQDALRLGLDALCFTDHVDYGVKRDWDDPRGVLYRPGGPGEPAQILLANVDHPRYTAEYAALEETYRSRIDLKLGMEFGMQVHTIPQFQALFGRYP